MANTLDSILQTVTLREMGTAEARVVEPEASLSAVHEALGRERSGAVVVCRDGKPLGIFTDRDVLYRTALEAIEPSTPIGELMTPDPTTLSPGDRVADAVSAMTRGGLRHVPLVDDAGLLAGIVSSRSVLRFIASHYPQSVLNLPPRLRQRLTNAEGG